MKELLLFVCLMIGHSFGISEQKVVKSGRLFSNPFGILGHEACPTTLKGRNVTGICYNEMECLLRLVLDIFPNSRVIICQFQGWFVRWLLWSTSHRRHLLRLFLSNL